MKAFGGKILFLDRADINTDEIIPAKYLTELSKEALKPFLLEDLILDGFDPARDIPGRSAIITRENFGCGSSREHAPWALEVNGINVVIAPGFARIFRQNMYNCGMLAIELGAEEIEALFSKYSGQETSVSVDIAKAELTFKKGDGGAETIHAFTLDGFDRKLVEAGGWVEYADTHY
jgi:3-isopropylmalate/(R)-2-methylmalate dehydratase small subunit